MNDICAPDGAGCEENDDHYGGTRQSEPLDGPATSRRSCFIEAGADAREKGGRDSGVRRDVEARINGGEEGLFLFERGTAIEAGVKMGVQFALRFSAGGCSLDQRVFIMFTWHRNFSANCLRA